MMDSGSLYSKTNERIARNALEEANRLGIVNGTPDAPY